MPYVSDGYASKSYAERSKDLGWQSEWAFDSWSDARGIAHVDWGVHNPPFSYFTNLPRMVRWQPDRLAEDTNGYVRENYHARLHKHFFVEVKGCGRQGVVKIKKQPLEDLSRIQNFFGRPILMFIYDSHLNRVSISHTHDDIVRLAPEMEERVWRNDGKSFYVFPTDVFIWESWTPPPRPNKGEDTKE